MLGKGSAENGSFTTAAFVIGAGLKLALPVRETPPCTSITVAVIAALPLAERAVEELESMYTPPAILMLALPEMESRGVCRRVKHDNRRPDGDHAGGGGFARHEIRVAGITDGN